MKILPSLMRPSRLALLAIIFSTSIFVGAPTQAATAKWEYTVVSARLKNRNLENLLNAYAAKGWELVQITDDGVAIFKRSK